MITIEQSLELRDKLIKDIQNNGGVMKLIVNNNEKKAHIGWIFKNMKANRKPNGAMYDAQFISISDSMVAGVQDVLSGCANDNVEVYFGGTRASSSGNDTITLLGACDIGTFRVKAEYVEGPNIVWKSNYSPIADVVWD